MLICGVQPDYRFLWQHILDVVCRLSMTIYIATLQQHLVCLVVFRNCSSFQNTWVHHWVLVDFMFLKSVECFVEHCLSFWSFSIDCWTNNCLSFFVCLWLLITTLVSPYFFLYRNVVYMYVLCIYNAQIFYIIYNVFIQNEFYLPTGHQVLRLEKLLSSIHITQTRHRLFLYTLK